MDATGASDIAICVADIDRPLGFYRDILGMTVGYDRIQDTTTGGLPHVYKHSRQTRRQVRLVIGEGEDCPTITMTTHPGEDADADPIKLDQIGLSHFSISVSDLKGLADDLASKGVEFAGPPESRLNARGELTSLYIYDPDGILLQFDAGGGG